MWYASRHVSTGSLFTYSLLYIAQSSAPSESGDGGGADSREGGGVGDGMRGARLAVCVRKCVRIRRKRVE